MQKSLSKDKIFCISFQRTGTTSVGQFFLNNGFSVATYDVSQINGWTNKWFEGNYQGIFSSIYFKENTVFEDDPWWCLDFYKFIYHKFPEAKFVLFTRNPDKWFDSMMRHSSGKTLGNTYLHSRLYRREKEFAETYQDININFNIHDNLLPLTNDHREHYKEIYSTRNQEVIEFFDRNNSGRLIHLQLEDSKKWVKLGAFFDLIISKNCNIHENKS